MSSCSTLLQHDSQDLLQLPTRDTVNPQFVALQGNFNVLLSDKITQAVLLQDIKQERSVEITQNSNILNIKDTRKLPFSGPIYVVVNAKNLEVIHFIGKGIVASNIKKPAHIDLDLTTNSSIVFEDVFDSRYIQLSGTGHVTFKQLHSDYLVLNVKNSIRAKIIGKINLQYLHLTERAEVSAHWVDSPFIRVITKNSAYAKLAGTVKILELAIQDNAKFNGEFLRADKVFVDASDRAKADIYAKDVRNISAHDTSKVYNHRQTTVRNDSISMHSAVLDVVR